MKFETRTEEDGKVVLKLGLAHEIGFPPEIDLEGVISGVTYLVEQVSSIDVNGMIEAVINEFEKGTKQDNDEPVSQ